MWKTIAVSKFKFEFKFLTWLCFSYRNFHQLLNTAMQFLCGTLLQIDWINHVKIWTHIVNANEKAEVILILFISLLRFFTSNSKPIQAFDVNLDPDKFISLRVVGLNLCILDFVALISIFRVFDDSISKNK